MQSAIFQRKDLVISNKNTNFAPRLIICGNMETTKTVHRRPNMVTIQMSQRRWTRMQSLEQAYKLACTIRRSMDQVESAPAMSAEEAIDTLRAL